MPSGRQRMLRPHGETSKGVRSASKKIGGDFKKPRKAESLIELVAQKGADTD